MKVSEIIQSFHVFPSDTKRCLHWLIIICFLVCLFRVVFRGVPPAPCPRYFRYYNGYLSLRTLPVNGVEPSRKSDAWSKKQSRRKTEFSNFLLSSAVVCKYRRQTLHRVLHFVDTGAVYPGSVLTVAHRKENAIDTSRINPRMVDWFVFTKF